MSGLGERGPSYIAPTDSPRIAVLWMIFGSVCFGTMNALVKWTSFHADVWMIIMVRSAFIAFAVAIFATSRGLSLKVSDKRKMLLTVSYTHLTLPTNREV